MVGAGGFEPPTFWSRTKRATSLRYTPTDQKRDKNSRKLRHVKRFPEPFFGSWTANGATAGQPMSGRPILSESDRVVRTCVAAVARRWILLRQEHTGGPRPHGRGYAKCRTAPPFTLPSTDTRCRSRS